MRTNQPELIERVTVRLNRATVTAIQKSGQSASDWLRQAVRSGLVHKPGQGIA